MKQTAVKWYAMQEAELAVDLENKKITGLQFIDKKLKILEQALAMEKEQMENASCGCIGGWEEGEFDIYYKETYGGNNAD